jgi:hypothetical protein
MDLQADRAEIELPADLGGHRCREGLTSATCRNRTGLFFRTD